MISYEKYCSCNIVGMSILSKRYFSPARKWRPASWTVVIFDTYRFCYLAWYWGHCDICISCVALVLFHIDWIFLWTSGFSHATTSWADFILFSQQMAALAGNYVNFGVFELYGDRALSDALDIALKMTLSIPLADILAFRKVWSI